MNKSIKGLVNLGLISLLFINLKVVDIPANEQDEQAAVNSNITEKMTQTGWNYIDGNWYYIDSSGKLATGWKYWNKAWYYLNADGKMATGWIEENGNRYYLNSSGIMVTDWNYIDNNWYYFDPSGTMAKGWRYWNKAWYYMYPDGKMATGWIEENGNRYYLSSSGAMVTGWKYMDNNWYYFDPSGTMAKGWRYWSKNWYYMHPDGRMAIGFINDGNADYYINSSGIMLTGWVYLNNSWYYFEPSGMMAKGWRYWNKNWYYMHSDGRMATGFVNDGNADYYLEPSGVMVTGWRYMNNSWYYFEPSGMMAKGWRYWNKNWYLMDNEGKMLSGWNKVDGKWYYLEPNGIMATGWRYFNGEWYYLESNGIRATNKWLTINGVKYWFNGQGIMADKEAIISGESYNFDSNGRYLGKLKNKPYLFVEVLKTGDSDSIYIELPTGEDILIDGGEVWHGDYLVNYLKTRNLAEEDGVEDIDYVINTHPHSDHIAGFIKVFENFKVNKFYYPYDIEMKRYEGFEGAESIENQGYNINCMNYCYQFYEKVLNLAEEKQVEIYDTTPNTYIDPYNILKFVHPDKIYKQNYLDKAPEDIIGTDYCSFNNDSAVIFVDYYDFEMLITGDIHKEAERDIINFGLIPGTKVDVLKVAHHGYNTSSSEEFINAIRPSIGVVTRSKVMHNSPSVKEANDILAKYNVDLLETWRENIKIYANDRDWNVEY
ncbi:MBL fold metallo-hydrolase [Clostridium isatidis]|uniref:Metallo-beta-lactamase domain-containing protein n=1 Tax=Clostridium isatidis TaxID=182773 RepID=A0A343JA54_9CLOT|nr:MBL fold metallo-hydrolase [Clostridium isatidis]ASW42412.1 hypothetical protein BEN51_02610 [Clostridium isatidis]